MSTAATSVSGAGGGTASSEMNTKPLKITSELLLTELEKIFKSLAGLKETLSVNQFKSFLRDTQKFQLYDERSGNKPAYDSPSWISTIFHPSQPAYAQKLLGIDSDISFDEFVSYLCAPTNAALALPDPRQKDWTRPLNQYYISSSHNTYLTGNQLYGASSIQGYINVLKRGCRCIEIDVWDGSEGEPEVFHGYTLTKEISFKHVCKAIGEHAFSKEGDLWRGGAGEGPVIISLECHADATQQAKMVKIMEEQWGDMLVMGIEPESVKVLPSPLELRRKIIVKVKYSPPEPEETPVSVTAPRAPRPLINDSSSSDSELEELSKAANKKKPHKAKVIRRLSELGAYCSAHRFPGPRFPAVTQPDPFIAHKTSKIPNHVYSFSEKAFLNWHQHHAEGVFKHNIHHLMRVYPDQMRFSSSNADPTPFWRQGVQFAALNWQKCDGATMLNEGMFAGEGGYVLKPESHRPGGDPKAGKKNLDLKIQLLAAANIPLPEKDEKPKSFEPYVKLVLHVEGSTKHKGRTKAKRNIECVWNETIEFKGVPNVVEMLSFLRIKIHDEEIGHDDLAAWACIRLDRLQEGYRFVNLFNKHGEQTEGVILVKIEKNLY
ncbi:hypothetical protein RUND412_001759 [Rhizina undulata]